jgi:hypothetical protein
MLAQFLVHNEGGRVHKRVRIRTRHTALHTLALLCLPTCHSSTLYCSLIAWLQYLGKLDRLVSVIPANYENFTAKLLNCSGRYVLLR